MKKAMKAKVKINTELNFDDIIFGKDDDIYNLSGLLAIIHSKVTDCIQDISIQRQSEYHNLDDIDVQLYSILNLIEKIQGY
jgi:hypothetical protein